MVEGKERKTFSFLFHYSRNCTMKLSLFIVYISVVVRFCFGIYISIKSKAKRLQQGIIMYFCKYIEFYCHRNIQHAITSHIFLMSCSPASVIYYIHKLKGTLFLTKHFFHNQLDSSASTCSSVLQFQCNFNFTFEKELQWIINGV